jgi:hypothetical protein
MGQNHPNFPASFVDLIDDFNTHFGEPNTQQEVLELRAILYRQHDPLAALHRIVHVVANSTSNIDTDMICRVLTRVMRHEPTINIQELYTNARWRLSHTG